MAHVFRPHVSSGPLPALLLICALQYGMSSGTPQIIGNKGDPAESGFVFYVKGIWAMDKDLPWFCSNCVD